MILALNMGGEIDDDDVEEEGYMIKHFLVFPHFAGSFSLRGVFSLQMPPRRMSLYSPGEQILGLGVVGRPFMYGCSHT